MKKILFIISLLPCLALYGQDSTRLSILEIMKENVTVYADSAVHRLLQDKVEGIVREEVQIQGYRVQVYSSNNQQTAKNEAFQIEKKINDAIQVETYVLYNPPFWKVRVGNFRTQEEANLMKAEIIRLLPELQADTYIVRDQIQIIQ